MILHDFIYEWDGKTTKGEKPVSWWPGSYHVKIVKLGTDKNNISYLVPIAVILKNAKTQPSMMNTSLKNYIHNFAQKLSKEYNLNISKTLWIEIDDKIRVAVLTPVQKNVPETLYSISWRSIRPNELAMIKPYIFDM
ncbi:hypothetical protein [Desulfobacula toluolica]|uniref:hypothetical protein n=1 Tax=Desulfobacula toluolica TaxID=28223 RepID=UPI00030026B4|nr:hypothetical protein [Desulfobacula toluolica]